MLQEQRHLRDRRRAPKVWRGRCSALTLLAARVPQRRGQSRTRSRERWTCKCLDTYLEEPRLAAAGQDKWASHTSGATSDGQVVLHNERLTSTVERRQPIRRPIRAAHRDAEAGHCIALLFERRPQYSAAVLRSAQSEETCLLQLDGLVPGYVTGGRRMAVSSR